MAPQALRYLTISGDLPLPMPDLFPELRGLTQSAPVAPAWLDGLRRLTHLQRASITIQRSAAPGAEGAAVAFPPVASLTSLYLWLGQGVASVSMPFDGLPALQLLDLRQTRDAMAQSRANLAASGRAPRLELLSVNLRHVTADFGLMPVLRSLVVGAGQLVGPASIASATALTSLCLGRSAEEELSKPFIAELLRQAPPSLVALELIVRWTPEVADIVVHMTQVALACKGIAACISDCSWPLPFNASWGLECT